MTEKFLSSRGRPLKSESLNRNACPCNANTVYPVKPDPQLPLGQRPGNELEKVAFLLSLRLFMALSEFPIIG